MVLTRGEIHSKNGGMRWVCVLCTIPINPKLYKKFINDFEKGHRWNSWGDMNKV
jgi:hypothetical protein